jgi:hypothetical protein
MGEASGHAPPAAAGGEPDSSVVPTACIVTFMVPLPQDHGRQTNSPDVFRVEVKLNVPESAATPLQKAVAYCVRHNVAVLHLQHKDSPYENESFEALATELKCALEAAECATDDEDESDMSSSSDFTSDGGDGSSESDDCSDSTGKRRKTTRNVSKKESKDTKKAKKSKSKEKDDKSSGPRVVPVVDTLAAPHVTLSLLRYPDDT